VQNEGLKQAKIIDKKQAEKIGDMDLIGKYQIQELTADFNLSRGNKDIAKLTSELLQYKEKRFFDYTFYFL
jgi:hypothetical protein